MEPPESERVTDKYQSAGVDIAAQDLAIESIRKLAASTFTAGVETDLGRFGGLFALGPGHYQDPLLVASTDGVGTKLRVAFLADRHDTVGYDLVAHCVDDILTQGARPLFFLDYIALHRMEPAKVEAIVSGMAKGCREAGCALIGGELAEMGKLYKEGEYDLAGFIVGIVERDRYLHGRDIEPGDRLLGLASNGLHTNGFTLARKILFETMGLTPEDSIPGLSVSAADALLATHRLYLPSLMPLIDEGIIKGLAHITGGGLTDNVPRAMPEGTAARIRRASFPVPPIFRVLEQQGDIPTDEMYRDFNMGIGMVAMVAPERVEEVTSRLREKGETVYEIGAVVKGAQRVVYE